MALRKPLVIANGQIEQLQPGDTLDAPSADPIVVQLVNDEAAPIVIGAPVYSDANDGVKKARANSLATAKVIGLVSDVTIANGVAGGVCLSGPQTATTAQWDAVTGDVGGLVFGTDYYVDPATAGKLTKTAPVVAGQVVAPVGRAYSTTEMSVNIRNNILL